MKHTYDFKNIFEMFDCKDIHELLEYRRSISNRIINLRKADLRNTNFQNTNLVGTDFKVADLRGANFKGADLRYTNFKGADLYDANFENTKLRGVNFDFSVLNLSCKGIGLYFDERVIKQLANHFLKQNNHCEVYEEIKQSFLDNPKWLDWLENWHKKDEVKHLKYYVGD